MSNDMVVGSIKSNVTPPLSGGIYEALLEKAQREIEEQARLLGMGSEREARLITERDEARALLERKWHEEDPPLIKMMRERDHYKTSMETLLKSINDWTGSMVKEPADDFVVAIEAYIEAKLGQ